MNAKLLGAVTAAVLLGSVGVASAQGPMQLTDAQLDVVTAGAPTAFASASVMNGNVNVGIVLQAMSDTGLAALTAANFVNTEPNSAGTFRFVVSVTGGTD